MITVEKLNQFGADTQDGISRCMGMDSLYLKLVGMAPDEKNFDLLKDAIEANNLDQAFEAAHALKGVMANLSLTPLSEKVIEITELLRKRTETDYGPLLKDILDLRDKLRELCSD